MAIHFLWEVQYLRNLCGTLKCRKFQAKVENKDRSREPGGQEEPNIHTWYSQAVIYPRTNQTQPWLVSEIRQGRTKQGCCPLFFITIWNLPTRQLYYSYQPQSVRTQVWLLQAGQPHLFQIAAWCCIGGKCYLLFFTSPVIGDTGERELPWLLATDGFGIIRICNLL